MGRVTLTTIARHSGLSKFAVSRALSGKSGVSEATRRRIVGIAAELGYARQGQSADAPTIAVVFHDADPINSELHMMIQSGVQAEGQRLGYRIAVSWAHTADEIEAVARTADGVLLTGPHEREALARAYSVGTPITRVGWLDPLEPADKVSGTDHEGGAAVARYLVELGHRSIAYVHGLPGYRGRIERYHGMREALEERLDVDFHEMRFQPEVRFTETFLAMREAGVRPTALFCAHDGLAVTVLSELLRLGYRIPEDVSVVGFGDYSSATQISPALTTVHVHGRNIGAACVRLLDDRLNGRVPPDIHFRVHIAGHIVRRDSSGPAPAGGAR